MTTLRSETPFEVPIPGGIGRGHVAGEGELALLVHGGAAVTDYWTDAQAPFTLPARAWLALGTVPG